MSQSTEEYLVGARNPASRAQDLKQFLDALAGRQDASVKSGSVDSRLVIEVGPGVADELRRRFGQRLIIEPNEKLTY